MPTQSLQVIGYSKEVTAGTFVPPTKFVPGTVTPNTTTTVSRPTQSRGTLTQVLDVPTGQTSGLQLSCEMIPEVVSGLIAGWFGTGSDALTGSGSVGYTHTLTPQNGKPTYSLEVDNDIYSQILVRQFVMNIIDQMTITYQGGQFITAQFQTVGQREITPATPGLPSNPTPAINTLQPMAFSIFATTLAGTASTQLLSATLTASNQTQNVVASNGQIYPTRLQPTMRNVTFSTSTDFLNTQFFNYWQGLNTGQGFVGGGGIVLTLTNPAILIPGSLTPYKVQFTLPNLRPQDQYSLTAASDVLQEQMTWSITSGGAANEISAVIVNSESSALA